MSNRLFIGGLSWDTTKEGLKEAFSKFGEVTDAHVVTDRDTGKSRGFGFISFAAPDQAEEAIEEMHDSELDGRRIRVAVAEERQNRGGGGGDRGGDRPQGGHRQHSGRGRRRRDDDHGY